MVRKTSGTPTDSAPFPMKLAIAAILAGPSVLDGSRIPHPPIEKGRATWHLASSGRPQPTMDSNTERIHSSPLIISAPMLGSGTPVVRNRNCSFAASRHCLSKQCCTCGSGTRESLSQAKASLSTVVVHKFFLKAHLMGTPNGDTEDTQT